MDDQTNPDDVSPVEPEVSGVETAQVPVADAADAPVAMLASGGDWLVPYSCSVATVDGASRLGTPTWRNLYPNESAHAQDLYRQHQPEVDRGWRLFLIDQLALP